MKHSQNPPNNYGICSIIPPHILKSIARNGTEAARAKAQKTLAKDAQIRLQCAAQVKVAQVKAELIKSRLKTVQGAGAAHKNRMIYTANNSTTLPGTLIEVKAKVPMGISQQMKLTMA